MSVNFAVFHTKEFDLSLAATWLLITNFQSHIVRDLNHSVQIILMATQLSMSMVMLPDSAISLVFLLYFVIAWTFAFAIIQWSLSIFAIQILSLLLHPIIHAKIESPKLGHVFKARVNVGPQLFTVVHKEKLHYAVCCPPIRSWSLLFVSLQPIHSVIPILLLANV